MIPPVSAVSVLPAWAGPAISGAPVASPETSVTGSSAKLSTSLPSASSSLLSSSVAGLV